MQIYQITSPWTIKKISNRQKLAATNLNALLTWSYEGGWRTRWLPSCPPFRHGEPGGSGAGRSSDSQTSGTPELCWDNLHSPKENIRKFVWICTNCEFLIKNSLYKQHETTWVITHVNLYLHIMYTGKTTWVHAWVRFCTLMILMSLYR